MLWSWYTGRWWVRCYIWYSEKVTGLCGPAQTPHRCTKYNSSPINGQCTNHRIAVRWSAVRRAKSINYRLFKVDKLITPLQGILQRCSLERRSAETTGLYLKSANLQHLNQNWCGIRVHITASLPKCCGLIPCRRRSFRRVSWKSAADCMRNANKCPNKLNKVSYSAMVKGNGKAIRNPYPTPDDTKS